MSASNALLNLPGVPNRRPPSTASLLALALVASLWIVAASGDDGTPQAEQVRWLTYPVALVLSAVVAAMPPAITAWRDRRKRRR